jgi:hypothetical protein
MTGTFSLGEEHNDFRAALLTSLLVIWRRM